MKVWGALVAPFHPKGVPSSSELWTLHEPLSSSSPNLAHHVFIELTLYTGVFSCFSKFGPLLVPVKQNSNATAYEDILNSCVVLALWQGFEEEPHIGVMVRCLQNYTVYILPGKPLCTDLPSNVYFTMLCFTMLGWGNTAKLAWFSFTLERIPRNHSKEMLFFL